MPRRFFRKFAFKRHQVSNQWFMSPFRHLLQDHRLWGIRRRTVVPAFSLGLFISFLPTPGHTLMGALAALGLRVNIPVAALATWVSNPVTMIFMYTAAYQLGRYLTGSAASGFHIRVVVELGNDHFPDHLATDAAWLPDSRYGFRSARLRGAGCAMAPVYCRLQDTQAQQTPQRRLAGLGQATVLE